MLARESFVSRCGALMPDMAAMKKTPESTIAKWLGHTDTKNTAIYTTASGAEEDELARRMWE